MSIKSYAIGALVAVTIAAGVGWYRTEIARARAQGRIEVLTVQIEQQERDYHGYRDSVAVRDSVRDREMVHLREAADSLDGELVIARRQARASIALVDSVLAGLPDSITRPVNDAIATLRRENDVCSMAFRNCREMLSVETERATDYGRQVIKADSLIRAQRHVIDQLENMGQRSTLLPWVVAGAALVVAGAVIVF